MEHLQKTQELEHRGYYNYMPTNCKKPRKTYNFLETYNSQF